MRGIAAIFVAIFHYQLYFADRYFFNWAWICVDLFFLISGVVMTHVYETRIEERSITFPEFLSHRIARLWPVHVFAMLVMLELEITLSFIAGEAHLIDWNAPVYTFLLNLVFLQHIGLYNSATWDGNGWSLTPEIFTNLIWFYLVATRKLSSKLLITILLSLSVLQYNVAGTLDGVILNSYLVRCAISYCVGCLLYRHFIANRALAAPSRVWCDLITAGLLGLICILIYWNQWNTDLLKNWDWILVLFVFPTFTYFALQSGTSLNAILSSRFFVFLGSLSYCVYLFHIPVGILLGHSCARWHIDIDPPYVGIVYLLLTIGLAVIVRTMVEIPSRNALRNRLAPYLAKIFFDRY